MSRFVVKNIEENSLPLHCQKGDNLTEVEVKF